MRQFIGVYEHTVDSVNRLVIPAKWRTGKSEELVLLVRDAGSLSVLTQEELTRILQQIDAAANLSPRDRRDRRQMFSSARQVTCDKQGRITLEAEQLKKIGVKDAVVLVGGVERFEIYNPKAWKQRDTELDGKREAFLEEMGI